MSDDPKCGYCRSSRLLDVSHAFDKASIYVGKSTDMAGMFTQVCLDCGTVRLFVGQDDLVRFTEAGPN